MQTPVPQMVNEEDLRAYLAATELKQKVLPASAFALEMAERLVQEDEGGVPVLPWAKTHAHFALRPGEVSVWGGINGHGKSQMLGQVALSLCAQEQRVCIASFEMKPWRQLQRLVRQASRGDSPTPEFIASFANWTDGKLWFYDQQGMAQAEWVVALVRYCADKLRVGHVVVDSLMKVVRGEDDYNGQKDFVDQLCAVARDTGVHVHLVHHVKKLEDERRDIGKMSIKGSGSIADQIDNLLLVWRNVRKEGNDKFANEPDALLIVDKQRNGEWQGRWSLWFDRLSMQFVEGSDLGAMDLLRDGLQV